MTEDTPYSAGKIRKYRIQQQRGNSEFYRERTLEELAAEQNVAPANFKRLLGNFWPKDENINDFIKFYRELRDRG